MKFALLSAGVLALALSVPAIAAQPPVPADGLVLQGSNPKKPVTNNPSTHKTVERVVCHHPVDGKESYAKCATAGCHDNLKDKKGTNSLYYVMHAKEKADAPLQQQSCQSCHGKVVAEKPDLKKDLTGCAKSKCHP